MAESGMTSRFAQRALGILVGISSAIAAGIVWSVVEKEFSKPAQAVVVLPPPAPQEHLDSAVMAEVSAAIGFQLGRNALIALLDPESPEAAGIARDLVMRARRATPTLKLAILFIPKGDPPTSATTEGVLALECARRQGRELELLEAARGKNPTEMIHLGAHAHLGDVAQYVGCILRRESMLELTNAIVLRRMLRIETVPAAFIVNRTIIRKPIDAGSLLVLAKPDGELAR